MSLKFLKVTDLVTFLAAVASGPAGTTFEIERTGAGLPADCYLHSIDKVVVSPFQFEQGAIGISGDTFGRIAFDVNLADPSGAFVNIQTTFESRFPIAPGDSNRVSGQKMYASDTGDFSTSHWETVFPLSLMDNDQTEAFPTVVSANGPIRIHAGINDFVSSNSGGWISNVAVSGGFGRGWWLFFEGLTDGIPASADAAGPTLAETNLTGTNVYPKGLALVKMSTARIPAPVGTDATATDDNSMCWLDLNTGGLAGRMHNIPGVAHSTEPNSESPVAGFSFDWFPAQYIPDTDATAAKPKGQLMFVSSDADVGLTVGFDQTIFVKLTDFNPFAVATSGTPPRIHERVTLSSAVVFNKDPMFGLTGGALMQVTHGMRLNFHPPSQRFFMIGGIVNGIPPTDAGNSAIAYWSNAVDPTVVTSPVARDVPRTNDIIEYETFVGGTLGEAVAGVGVTWSLFRNSTELETLDASTFPGTSTVANFPIDNVEPVVNEGTLVVVADTVTLVETTDYTVNLTTGVITWVTDQSGKTLVTATYEHRNKDATPAHGTLLSTTSQTDVDGRAFTNVRFADDNTLVGLLDRLIVVTT